jgi:L-2-hydroxyglutarate oxidase LhgO
MRVIVVGGGILGLATAHRLLDATDAAEVIVLESEPAPALHQSSHNSGVVHQGVYYAPGSLKARLCRRGAELLRDFCRDNAVPYDECGKLVVATSEDELGRLDALEQRARTNGVPGLRRLHGRQLAEVEPHVRGLSALHSPETAITDFAAVAGALGVRLRAAGAEVRTRATVTQVMGGGMPTVALADGSQLRADRVIVCAGLHSDRLALASGRCAEPRIVPFRGEYWKLRGERASLVRGMIYPVPDPGLPFLGVHLTRRLDGSVWVGPNAVPALARHGYRWRDVSPRDMIETLAWPGTWRLLRRHWRAAAGELVRSMRKDAFAAQVRRYVPALEADDFVRGPAGVRAQALDRDGSLVDDFRLDAADGVVWVRNAPSPAATSSLAIAEELLDLALEKKSLDTQTRRPM